VDPELTPVTTIPQSLDAARVSAPQVSGWLDDAEGISGIMPASQASPASIMGTTVNNLFHEDQSTLNAAVFFDESTAGSTTAGFTQESNTEMCNMTLAGVPECSAFTELTQSEALVSDVAGLFGDASTTNQVVGATDLGHACTETAAAEADIPTASGLFSDEPAGAASAINASASDTLSIAAAGFGGPADVPTASRLFADDSHGPFGSGQLEPMGVIPIAAIPQMQSTTAVASLCQQAVPSPLWGNGLAAAASPEVQPVSGNAFSTTSVFSTNQNQPDSAGAGDVSSLF
jgi:hypothetical protein